MGLMSWIGDAATTAMSLFSGRNVRDEDNDAVIYRQPMNEEKVRAGVKMPYFLPFLDQQQNLGETQEMRLAYRLMMSDANVKPALLGKLMAVMGQELRIKAPKRDKSDRMMKIVDFVDWSFNERLSEGIPGLVWDILSGACIDGFSVNEKVFGLEDEGLYAGKRVLRRLKAKDVNQDLVLEVDEFRNIVGVKALRYNDGTVYNPRDFLIYTHLGLFENPTGTSDMRAAYAKWWMLDTVTKLRAMGAERRYLPLIYGEYKTPQNQKSLESAMAQIRARNWLAVPTDTKLNVLDIAGASDAYFSNFRKDLQEDIWLSIQGATLQALTGGAGQMRGASATHKDTADLFKWHLGAAVTHLLNDHEFGLIRDMVEPNFLGVYSFPKATFGGIDDAELTESLNVDRGLFDMGYPISLDELSERYGRSIGKGEDALKNPATQQQPQPGGAGGPGGDDLEGLLGGTGGGEPPPSPPAGGNNGEEPDPSNPKPPMPFSEKDWRQVKGERGGTKWINVKTQTVVYGKENPGKGTEEKKPEVEAKADVAKNTPATPEQLEKLKGKADNVAEEISTRTKGLLQKVGAAGKWIKSQGDKVFGVLEKRYGRKQAAMIFGAGQVVAWGTTAAGAYMGVPLVIPGQSVLSMVPFAAAAEVYLQAGKLLGKHAEEQFAQLSMFQIKKLGKQTMKHLIGKWRDAQNSDQFAEDIAAGLDGDESVRQFSEGFDDSGEDDGPETHDYSCAMLMLKGKNAALVRMFADMIVPDDEDLDDKGREDDPHVTVLYGLHTNDAGDVEEVVGNFGPVKIRLGETKFFSSPERDVVYIEVEGKKLHELHHKLEDELEYTNDHPSYVPHMTLAYVKPGLGQKFSGNTHLSGTEFTIGALTFSPADGDDETVIPIAGAESFSEFTSFAGKSDPWVAHTGKRGGKGWRNSETGRIVYGAKKPGGGAKAKEVPAKDKPKEADGDIHGHVRTLLHQKLTAKQGRDLVERIKTMKVSDINALKKQLGVKASGTKADLAQRIADHVKKPSIELAKNHLAHLDADKGLTDDERAARKKAFLGKLTKTMQKQLADKPAAEEKPKPEPKKKAAPKENEKKTTEEKPKVEDKKPAEAKPASKSKSPAATAAAKIIEGLADDIDTESDGGVNESKLESGLAKELGVSKEKARGIISSLIESGDLAKGRVGGTVTVGNGEPKPREQPKKQEEDTSLRPEALSTDQVETNAAQKNGPASRPYKDGVKMGDAVKGAMQKLMRFTRFEDGLIPLHFIYHEMKKGRPDLSVDEFHDIMADLRKNNDLHLSVQNEVREMVPGHDIPMANHDGQKDLNFALLSRAHHDPFNKKRKD